ncbi:ToxR-activated A protein [Vibrio cholerae]|nr:ToxR-activated A protein [Vibrio cholerae]
MYCGEHELTSIKVSDNPDIKLLKGPIIVRSITRKTKLILNYHQKKTILNGYQ